MVEEEPDGAAAALVMGLGVALALGLAFLRLGLGPSYINEFYKYRGFNVEMVSQNLIVDLRPATKNFKYERFYGRKVDV